MKFKHMEENMSLERLKSIRQRYGCQKSSQRAPQDNVGFVIPNYQYMNLQSKRPYEKYQINDKSSISPSKQNWKQQGKDYRFQIRDRSSCVAETNKNIQTKLSFEKFDNLKSRNHSNFTGFIKDLDARILQKQKMLNARFKQNQKILQQKNINPEKTANHLSSKYKSSKNFNYYDLKTDRITQKMHFPSRQVSDNSLIQKYTNRDSQKLIFSNQTRKQPHFNILQKKLMKYENSLDPKYNLRNLYTESTSNIQQKIRQYDNSPIKRLDNRQIQNMPLYRQKDSWNMSKMQDIQQRIKSVLKQSNY